MQSQGDGLADASGGAGHERSASVEVHAPQATGEDIIGKLRGFSQTELRTIDAYERKNQSRTTITDRIAALITVEPWKGYDDEGVGAIKQALGAADPAMARAARAYERDHKDRTGVIEAADRRIESA